MGNILWLECMVMFNDRDEFANVLFMIVIEGEWIVVIKLNRLMYE